MNQDKTSPLVSPRTRDASWFQRLKSALVIDQLGIAIPYLVFNLAALGFSIYYANKSFKLAVGWLVVGIVSSQIVIDLAKFPTPVTKGRFSAIFRFLAGASALALLYFF